MTLTKDDLLAIKGIVDDAIDDSKLQTAAGFAEVHEKFAEVHEKFAEVHEKFAEVHEKFDKVDQKFAEIDEKFDKAYDRLDNLSHDLQEVKHTVNRIESIQRAEVTRVDEHAEDIKLIKRKLKLA
jgi:uncharacterized coiled-coil DUF342 family protein